MNNIFSLTRFSKLFKKHLLEKSKEYLLSILTLTIIVTAFLSFLAYKNASGLKEDLQGVAFVVSIILSGIVFTSTIFSDLGNKKKSITYLMLPASHLEKYLINWLFSYLFFQIVFIAVFYLSVIIVLSLQINDLGNNNVIMNLFDTQKGFHYIFFFYLIAHSIMFFGSIYYRKKHFIKTIFSFFSVAAIFSIFNKLMLNTIIRAEVLTFLPFSNLKLVENDKYYYLVNDKNGLLYFLLALLITVLLWLTAYFNLKEKEV